MIQCDQCGKDLPELPRYLDHPEIHFRCTECSERELEVRELSIKFAAGKGGLSVSSKTRD